MIWQLFRAAIDYLPMLRLLLISWVVALCLATFGSLGYGQERSISPYFGVSGSLDTNVNPGWGIEAGMHFLAFYAGLEYGMYSYRNGRVVEYDPVPGRVPLPYPISAEVFWGFHAGYVISDKFYVGIVVLKSHEMWEIATSDSTSYTTARSYLNIGPDLRFSGFDDGQIYLAFAYTIRRGLKAGLGYMF